MALMPKSIIMSDFVICDCLLELALVREEIGVAGNGRSSLQGN